MALALLSGTVMFASPVFAFGGGTGNTNGEQITTLHGLITLFYAIINTVVPFLIGLGVFVIIYGVFAYLSHAGEEEKRTEARQFVLWGVIGVFIMVSIWGLINILVNTFDFKRTAPTTIPSVFPGQSGGGDDDGGLLYNPLTGEGI